MAITVENDVQNTTIRPFTIEVPEADLDDLRARIRAARFPDRETVEDQSQGTQLATLQALARHWATEYDWRRCEARINSFPHFMTEIDGLDIHFIHVRSKHDDALPIVICHGWPGSIVEQLKIIEPLTDPTAHGGEAADAFHVVIPSMPGYGYSGKPTETGWGPDRMGRAYVELMRRLGYTRFVAQGGDWGALVVQLMAVDPPPELLGIHTNMAGTVPPELEVALAGGAPVPSDLTGDERAAAEQLSFFYKHVYYAYLQGDRPQSLAAIADSPVGLAAFMLDHDAASLDLITRSFAGEPVGLSRDDVLDNITHFWLTNSGVSAARLYWENKFQFFGTKGITIPVAVSVFPDELYQVPRSWAEKAFPNLVHYNRLPAGGHFAAWEQPKLFTDEVRAGLRSLR
ncbi:MAG TPA: epoxide hydrolase [Actinophytocola sp.]|nr:epoxide hydrolase [Actinophytocola sp.]